MSVQDKSTVWEFTVYHLVGIDAILGMNSLSKNHVIIDYNKKKLYLAGDGGKKLFFREKEQGINQYVSLISR